MPGCPALGAIRVLEHVIAWSLAAAVQLRTHIATHNMFAKFRDSVKKEFHKLTGGSEEDNVQLIELAEDCTSESILAVDEGRISQLTSLIISGDVGCASGVRNVLAAALQSLVHAVFTCRADLS